MNEYKVNVTAQALGQMKAIIRYISEELCAPRAAEHLLGEWKTVISGLSGFPKRNGLVEEEPWRTEGIRRVVVKNFLVYYWVDDENFRVQVTAVIYNKRDQIRQLEKL